MTGLLELGAVEILSLGYMDPPIDCSKERWWAIFKDFQPQARSHAANLAAHNWDVLLIGGRVFLYQTKYGGEHGHWLHPDGAREDATPKQMSKLYRRVDGRPRRRRFARATLAKVQP